MGYVAPSSMVKVILGKQAVKTMADERGKWIVHLKSMKACKEPQKMLIESAANKVVLENILIGIIGKTKCSIFAKRNAPKNTLQYT